MKILVTGAGGFVGKRLVAKLASEGHAVVALLRKEPAEEDADYFAADSIDILIQDLDHLDVTALPATADALITLAQSARFREFPEQVQEVFSVNVIANLTLLEWAIGAGVKHVVHASSGGVYGGKTGEIFLETSPLAVDSPLGFYLGSKLCSEIVFQNFRQFFETSVILRPFFIYGPGQRSDMFIARLINSVREGLPISLQGKDGLRVNPIYVDDAVEAFYAALDLTGSHIINIAGQDILSLRQIGDAIGGVLCKKPVYENREGEPVDYVGDTAVSTGMLCFNPRNFLEGLTLTL